MYNLTQNPNKPVCPPKADKPTGRRNFVCWDVGNKLKKTNG